MTDKKSKQGKQHSDGGGFRDFLCSSSQRKDVEICSPTGQPKGNATPSAKYGRQNNEIPIVTKSQQDTTTLNGAPIVCSFCSTEIVSPTESHDCAQKAFTLLNAVAEEKNPDSLFKEIDNLVFQGGGVKGISYYGVLTQLEKRSPGILRRVKRVAGTSAGSLVALYLALNMTIDEIHQHVINNTMNLLDLLDDGITLDVCIDPLDVTHTTKKWTVKEIILYGMQKFNKIRQEMEDPKTHETAREDLAQFFTQVFKIYAYHSHSILPKMISHLASGALESILRWFLAFFIPDVPPQNKPTTHVIMKMDFYDRPKPQAPSSNEQSFVDTFDNIFKSSYDQAVENSKDFHIPHVTLEEYANPDKYLGEDNREKQLLISYRAQIENDFAPLQKSGDALKDDAEPDYALAELLFHIMYSQTDKEWQNYGIGFFSGQKIKENLINGPIKDKLLNVPNANLDPTFAQLASYKDQEGHNFKELYVTAFNIGTLRTEVFSHKHTPDVVVSDAIRASISIPIFFVPVTVRDKGQTRKIYSSFDKSQDIYYMDGGLFDNYPIWIFDDLQFCLQETLKAKWTPKTRLSIQNPRTLGFRLLDHNTLHTYMHPYFDQQDLQMKQVNPTAYQSSFAYIATTFAQAELTQQEESRYINEGNCPRTAYIDNNGINAIAFHLTKEQSDLLVSAGEKSVDDYIARAKTHFIDEGQAYP